jgi:MerR family transcriptional regulator, aldehyde-responsive regulator
VAELSKAINDAALSDCLQHGGSATVRRLSSLTIAEVSKRFNLSQDTLRYYERIGLIPSVNRTKSGIRNYTEEDCRWIEFIKCMRDAGLPIEVLIEYVRLFQEGDSTFETRKELLIEQRDLLAARLKDLENTLDKLNYKVNSYENTLLPTEKKLSNPD